MRPDVFALEQGVSPPAFSNGVLDDPLVVCEADFVAGGVEVFARSLEILGCEMFRTVLDLVHEVSNGSHGSLFLFEGFTLLAYTLAPGRVCGVS